MAPSGPHIGFVVSGALGNAVVRNRLKRRLRHLAAAHVAETPVGMDIAVRALPRPRRRLTKFQLIWDPRGTRRCLRLASWPDQDGGA